MSLRALRTPTIGHKRMRLYPLTKKQTNLSFWMLEGFSLLKTDLEKMEDLCISHYRSWNLDKLSSEERADPEKAKLETLSRIISALRTPAIASVLKETSEAGFFRNIDYLW